MPDGLPEWFAQHHEPGGNQDYRESRFDRDGCDDDNAQQRTDLTEPARVVHGFLGDELAAHPPAAC